MKRSRDDTLTAPFGRPSNVEYWRLGICVLVWGVKGQGWYSWSTCELGCPTVRHEGIRCTVHTRWNCHNSFSRCDNALWDNCYVTVLRLLESFCELRVRVRLTYIWVRISKEKRKRERSRREIYFSPPEYVIMHVGYGQGSCALLREGDCWCACYAVSVASILS